jgi:hypothetical protein
MILHSSKNGQIFICNRCHKIHLEFGNFTFDFSFEVRLKNFLEHLEEVDGAYYEELNRQSTYQRKIMIPVPETRMKMLFTLNELNEIRQLIRGFIGRNVTELIRVTRIEFDFNTFTPKHLN